ncbi:coiled-coil domain-containing protein 96-like [Schistocerca americana]|uniref:coiled-coil domain-containing protein 96-like n=1 Tax=Schistocerca americana TaxID=7009 RepID=UPI001F4FC3D1|nr:coiled-coil domain-containing protein 96-like [Schistocerca americana]
MFLSASTEVKQVLEETLPARVREGSVKAVDEESTKKGEEPAPQAEGDPGEESEDEGGEELQEISAAEHEENIVVMEQILESFLEMAAEGRMPTREQKSQFVLKGKVDSTSDLLASPEEDVEEELQEHYFMQPSTTLQPHYTSAPLEDTNVLPVPICKESEQEEFEVPEEDEEVAEEEEEESKSVQEAWVRRQQLLDEFDALHDEGQRLRIMNLLLQSRVLRSMRRPKHKGRGASSTASAASASASSRSEPQVAGDPVAIAETLEKELMEAGEVRRHLEAELSHSAEEEHLRNRLSAAREKVAAKEAQLLQLQEKAISKMRAPPGRRQEAERMLKRVWPQLTRLRQERLLHMRAENEMESAKRQVAELEAFGLNRSVAAYEQLAADGVKLAEHVQERTEQLTALRNAADRDLQQAAHLRETLQGAHYSVLEARRNDVRASMFLQKARQEVLKTKRRRDVLYKESSKLTQQMQLLAYPELLRNQEVVRWHLQLAQAELEKLRTAYANQERHIAAARSLLQQREQSLVTGTDGQSPQQSFITLHIDTKRGTSRLDIKYDS